MANKDHIPVKTTKGSVAVPDRLRALNESENLAVLATDDDGQPYTSLISFAVTPDLKSVLFATPRDTKKYRNIMKGKHVAILIDNRSGTDKGFMETEAITIIGVPRPLRRGKTWEETAAIFLKKHPGLEEFIKAESTALIVVGVVRCIHVSQFQTVSVWDNR